MNRIQVTADAEALCSRAAQFLESGRIGVARPLLAAAQALAAPSPDLTLISAQIELASGNQDQAIQQLDVGIAAAPSHAGLRRCRADLRQRIGDFEGAARDAAEALTLAPSDPQARAILGVALMGLGRSSDATICLTEAVAIAPHNPDYRQRLSEALESIGQGEAALRTLIEGIALCASNVPLRNAAILLCVRRRDFIQAARLAENARSLGIADACTFGLKGHALSSLGQHDEAAEAYQEALKLGPEDPYVRHLVVSSGALTHEKRAPEGYVRTVFDGYADRFEAHIISLGYRIPAAIRALLLDHPRVINGDAIGCVLDLGCGTGMVALAIGDLPVGPITGIDLSPRMLAHAKAKQLYAELHEGDIVAALAMQEQQWPLIVAADVLCYFGALEELLEQIHAHLQSGGWFIFSVETLLADHDGLVPGNGHWALQRQGRYAHSEDYIYEAVCAAGFRVLRVDRPVIRQEAGADVPGLLLAIECMRLDS